MFLFSVVVPMYNEDKIAQKCIKKILKAISKTDPKGHLIVVNDGSTDKTSEICNKIVHKNFKLISHDINRGYGASIQTALKFSIRKFKYLLYIDSDLTNDPNDIPKFIEKMKEDFDLIKGSRYVRGGFFQNVPFYRMIISYIGNKLAKFLFNSQLSDITNGFRAIKINNLKEKKFKQKDFSIIMEEFYYLKKIKAKIVEIPIILGVRNNSKSKFKYNLSTFFNYLKYPLRYSIRI